MWYNTNMKQNRYIKRQIVFFLVILRKRVKQMSGRAYWWVPKTLMSASEITLYCESYKGKKAVADVRAGIKHSSWSFEDQLV